MIFAGGLFEHARTFGQCGDQFFQGNCAISRPGGAAEARRAVCRVHGVRRVQLEATQKQSDTSDVINHKKQNTFYIYCEANATKRLTLLIIAFLKSKSQGAAAAATQLQFCQICGILYFFQYSSFLVHVDRRLCCNNAMQLWQFAHFSFFGVLQLCGWERDARGQRRREKKEPPRTTPRRA
jgi:hypothetical protein